MKHLSDFLKTLCLLAALGAILLGLPPQAEASSDVAYKVTDVTLKGDTITFKGKFINHSSNYQRALKMDIKYVLSDVDGYPLLSGTRRIGDLSIDIGGDPTAFSFTVDDSHAHEYQSGDIALWKIDADVEIE